MFHHSKNHKNSTSKHNLPQHEQDKGYPNKPAPGGSSTTNEQRKSFLQRAKEHFQKPPEKPATKEDVQQMGLDAQRSKYRYTKTLYDQKSKQMSKGSGWSSLLNNNPQPGRGQGRRNAAETAGSFFGPSNNGLGPFADSGGSSEGFNSMFGLSSERPTRGSKKQQPRSGLEDLF